MKSTHLRTLSLALPQFDLSLASASADSPAQATKTVRLLRTGAFAAIVAVSSASHAFSFGPDDMFNLKGFGEITVGLANNQCGASCQWFPTGTDPTGGPIVYKERDKAGGTTGVLTGQDYQIEGTTRSLFQPFLSGMVYLGKGFRLSGVLSQRWTNGSVDVSNDPGSFWTGYWYEKNVALENEDYGRLTIGHMITRARSVADYPYGTDVGLSWPWSGTGAGYGLLTSAVRYKYRKIEIAKGDLTLEGTYDIGDTRFSRYKPRFWELYAQYERGDLTVDAIVQDGRNGRPSTWVQGYFTGLTGTPSDEDPLYQSGFSGSAQGLALIMAKYQYNNLVQLSGGLRRNWWTGANAVNVISDPSKGVVWNNMFNVDWGSPFGAVDNPSYPGYPASSYDLMVGMRYRLNNVWVASAGLVRLGTASTDNPSERGQSNSALIGSLGLDYEFSKTVTVRFLTGSVRYAHLGLAPLSLGSNTSINSSDSRINQDSNWVTMGVTYGF